jgi:hypothetical protein
MNTKLTLSIEKSVIEKAKGYARLSGRSLSELIQSYLERLVLSSEERETQVPDEFKDLFGVLDLPTDLDDKAALRQMVFDKHSS